MKKIVTILTVAIIGLQANSFTLTDRARVIKSTPIYKTVTKRVPYQECWNEEVPVRRGSYNDDYPIGTIIGGVAGGVIGHQVGKGRGNDLATVGGAIIGSLVGHNLSKHERRYESTSYETRKRCVTKYQESYEEKFVGYKNIAKYKGRRIVKISNNRLRYIPIEIEINY
ncbi:glycine zipper 2TM domain-containing protein [Sulfurospirillum sp. 1307]|jgi:uncharacterized protein YcfJ